VLSALCVYLLIAFMKFQSKITQSMQQMIRLIHTNLFSRRDLHGLFEKTKPDKVLNTRFNRCAHVIAARCSSGIVSSCSLLSIFFLPLPRPAGVTWERCLLLGAKTPWKRVRLTRGFGTSEASRAKKSKGSNMTWVVPSLYGVFN